MATVRPRFLKLYRRVSALPYHLFCRSLWTRIPVSTPAPDFNGLNDRSPTPARMPQVAALGRHRGDSSRKQTGAASPTALLSLTIKKREELGVK